MFITSLKVAEVFGKEHFHVMEAIRSLDCPASFIESNFRLYEYEQKVGFGIRKNPMYLMTRDGFTFLAMGFNGARAAEFKEKFNDESGGRTIYGSGPKGRNQISR